MSSKDITKFTVTATIVKVYKNDIDKISVDKNKKKKPNESATDKYDHMNEINTKDKQTLLSGLAELGGSFTFTPCSSPG